MDFSLLDTSKKANEGIVVHLKHPKTGEPTGTWVKVLGSDSDAYEQKKADLAMERAKDGSTTFDVVAYGLEVLAACVVAWDGVEMDGQPLPCTTENVRKLLGQHKWLREDLEKAVMDRRNFFPS